MITDVLAFAADHVITIVWLKATIFFAALCLAQIALRRWSAGTRAAVGTLAGTALLLLPAVHYLMPQSGPLLLAFPTFLFQQAPNELAGLRSFATRFDSFGWVAAQPLAFWIAAVWIAGAAWFLGRLAWQTRRLSQMVRGAEPTAIPHRPDVGIAYSRDVKTPLTFGWRRPQILLPLEARGWTESTTSAVLAHELAHVDRRDYATLMLAQLTRAFYWMNPLAWYFTASLRAELECACDDAVIRGGLSPGDYVRHLVGIARPDRTLAGHAVLPMVRRSQLRARVLTILDHRVDRRVASLRGVLAAALVTMALASTLGAAGLWSCPGQAAAPPPGVAHAQLLQ